MLTREIGLTAALALISGIDKKARPYKDKDKSRLGHGQIQKLGRGGGGGGGGGGGMNLEVIAQNPGKPGCFVSG